MDDLIARMVHCGIPQKTAQCIANDYKRRDKLDALTLYVLIAEAEHENH